MYRGYVAVWRRIQDHVFYKEKRAFSKFEAWLDILMEVQHTEAPQEVVIGMKVFQCNYGESLKSIRTWGKRWGWGAPKVVRFLVLLKKCHQIVYKNETVTTRITVLNYSQYDPKRNGYDTQVKHERNASVTRPFTDKNVKNVKNDSSSTPLPPTPEKNSCPVLKIVGLYHEILPELATVQKASTELTTKIKARWNADKDRQTLDWWRWYFEGIGKCGFLMGRKKDWAATLHWLSGKENMEKVLSGYYLDRDHPSMSKAEEDFLNERV